MGILRNGRRQKKRRNLLGYDISMTEPQSPPKLNRLGFPVSWGPAYEQEIDPRLQKLIDTTFPDSREDLILPPGPGGIGCDSSKETQRPLSASPKTKKTRARSTRQPSNRLNASRVDKMEKFLTSFMEITNGKEAGAAFAKAYRLRHAEKV